DPPDRLGQDRLSPHLPRGAPALAGRRLPDLPRRDAALARRVGGGDGGPAERAGQALRPAGAGRPAGAPAAGADPRHRHHEDRAGRAARMAANLYRREQRARSRHRPAIPVRLMQLEIRYTTAYSYAEPVRRVIQLLRVTPPSFIGQTVLDWGIEA